MSHNRKLPFVNTNSIGLERAVCQQTSNSQRKGAQQSVTTELCIGSYCWLHVSAFIIRQLKVFMKKYNLHEYKPLKLSYFVYIFNCLTMAFQKGEICSQQ